MEEKIIFSISDYEKAIVRVLRSDDTEKFGVVGTGFLVAPGYVLTCTHVVLQALGQFDPDKETASDPPIGETVELDFPLAQGLPTKAEVLYNSQPYQKNSGDITVLKLLETAPQQSKPMPMIFHTWEEIQAERHAVHGFANDSGDRTDAYRPKSGAPGGRIQLWKAGADPLDEMIEGGFSGAPVWNYDRGGVIGMVATAASPQGQKSKAFAISTETLKPVLEQIKAFCLNDILSQSLDACSIKDERANFRIAIVTALNLCNPQGTDRSWQAQLVDLNCDRPPMTGWQTGSLCYGLGSDG